MIKDHQVAEKLIGDVQQALKIINESIITVMNSCSQEEFQEYRLASAHAMAEVFEKLLDPLCNDHPDLDPLNQKNEEPQSRNEDIQAYEPDAPLVMERLYKLDAEDEESKGINIQFFKPAKSKDADDWFCIWAVNSDFAHSRFKAFGSDAIESFLAALSKANKRASLLIGSSKISWVGGSDLALIEATSKI